MKSQLTGDEDRIASIKKRKDDVEAIVPVKRVKKQTYFFQPVNNLTNNHDIKSHDIKSSPTKPFNPVNINILKNKVQPVEEIKNSKTELNIVPDGSDDSFDGIKWRESSPKEEAHSKSGLPGSSPLRNVKTMSENLEQTNTVLSKYGSDFRNVSIALTPRMTKTYSDMTFAESKYKKITASQNSPTLYRTKSGDFSKSKDKFSLTTWLNKFEKDPEESKEKQQLPSSPDNPVNSEDPFSDDDLDIINAMTNASEKADNVVNAKIKDEPNTVTLNDNETLGVEAVLKIHSGVEAVSKISSGLKAVPKNDICEEEDNTESDDPFSDGDLDLPPALSEPKVNSFTKSFQDGILKLEKLDLDQTFQEREEKVTNLVYQRSMLRRYKIIKITNQKFKEDRKQLILEVIDGDETKTKLIVRGESTELEMQAGDIIHIIITNKENPQLVDDASNLLIWNPDILLSATTISQQILCPRKTVLNSRYKFPGAYSVPLIVGEIVHFIFQECIAEETWDLKFMTELGDSLLEDYLLHIFSINETKEKVKEEIDKHIPYLKSWFERYYKKPLSSNNYIDQFSSKDRIMFALEEALDIEEDIKSPVFGIKGKIDATITAKFLNNSVKGKFLIPMEIKTGREHVSHAAQASLYSLLFRDRYDIDINSFLLVYTKEQLTKKCDIRIADLKALINLRNKVTQYYKSNVSLPPVLTNSQCERCDVLTPCMTANFLLENGDESKWVPETNFNELMKPIDNEKYKYFLKYWDELIAKEEDIASRAIKELWTVDPQSRQADGKCLENMVIIDSNDDDSSRIALSTAHADKAFDSKHFNYTLKKNSDLNLLHTQFNEGDRVIISDEDGHFAITSASIKSITKDRLIITSRRRIITHDYKLKNFNKDNNQIYQGVLRGSSQQGKKKSFRIDKDEMFYGMGLARFNLLNLFLPEGAANIRRLVVDLEKPKYSQGKSFQLKNYNKDQVNAIEKVFQTKDYSLILGMPGTGKTTVITEIIKILISQGRSILLTSYTNTAVDNILLKLKEMKIDFLRIGYPLRVHKDIHGSIPGFIEPITSYEQFCDTYMKPQIVATTCLGITDVCFNLRYKFDYCIVDEASQISLPINLGPLSFADRFIMVGDHYQLPPLVIHPDARVKKGLKQSLFKILAEAHPESVCELTYQYRMCEDIMQLSNILVYENRLKCGSKEVADQSLVISLSYLNSISIDIPKPLRWMDNIFEPTNKVLFLDHDAKESQIGESIKNPTEALLIQQIVKCLTLSKVEEKEIGVMSFYRSQILSLKKLLPARIETLTADQFQGKDKQCIIISLVRSNDNKMAGELLKEWRRLNVAITRAKSKLIILGSRSTLSTIDITKTFIEFIDSKGWYYRLPENAETLYKLPLSATNSPTKKANKIVNKNIIIKNIMDDFT